MEGQEKISLSRDYLDHYQKVFEKRYEKLAFERQENNYLHNSVEWGNWIYDCLKRNDTDNMIRALNTVTDDYHPGKLSADDLRSKKNLIIGLISVLSNWAAKDRLVDNELVLTAADVCILMCEETKHDTELLQCAYAGLVKISDLMKQFREQTYHPLVKAAKEYIYQHLHDEICLKDLSAYLGVTPEHLSRTFHHAEGITLKQYITEERIHRARNLLRYSDYSITEIASYLAFSSPSHFTEIFKSATGKTPTEYRRDFVSFHSTTFQQKNRQKTD
mgnify:FL=1